MFGLFGFLEETTRLMHSGEVGEWMEEAANAGLGDAIAESGLDVQALSEMSADAIIDKLPEIGGEIPADLGQDKAA